MSLSMNKQASNEDKLYSEVGIGLRHTHYDDALEETDAIDFVEIHAENFFSKGGISSEYIDRLKKYHEISLHSVSMGPGSALGINQAYTENLKNLLDRTSPMLVSDHACFCWGQVDGSLVHAGDLLPIERTKVGLETISANVNKIQDILGRKILIENISSYMADNDSNMSEPEFLVELSNNTGCGLLIDLNNVLVNAHNFEAEPPLEYARRWLAQIPPPMIGEYHLAGSTTVRDGELLIDDHARPVSNTCWDLFKEALNHSGPKPTLIEWDNDIPPWEELVKQARIAKKIISESQADSSGRPQ